MKYILLGTLIILGSIFAMSLFPAVSGEKHAYTPHEDLMDKKPEDLPFITLAGGCFWCVESEYRTLPGVKYTVVGYTGGKTDNPSYQDITTGKTGHAEAVQIFYDPDETNYEDILRYFFENAHDPTQLNRQGVDVGTQYRSAVFVRDENEAGKVKAMIADIDAKGLYKDPIVTKIEPAAEFFVAEEYHQQYYEKYEEVRGVPHIRVLYKLQKKAHK